ncbi:MAG: plastocyanin/azurin family copper-binding protein [Nitrospinota bacterium]
MKKAILFTVAAGLSTLFGSLPGGGFAVTQAAETHKVIIRDFAFGPAKLTVKVGDTVEFVNEDALPHTATQDAGGGFDTEALTAGQSKKITFRKVGVFNYSCSIHPVMQAVIEVKE